jgi:hypothetical protein
MDSYARRAMMSTSKVPAVTGEWECTECGFITEGIESKRPSRCPECDAPADALEFFSYGDEADDEEEWDEDADEYDEAEDEDEDSDDLDDEEFDEEEDY